MIEQMYRCEICGEEDEHPVKWVVIHCSDAQLTVFKWTKEAADAPPFASYQRIELDSTPG